MDIVNNNEGYDATFVDEVTDFYKCVVCHLVLRDPVLLVECGHRLCSGCFERLKKHAADSTVDLLCPHDRVKIEEQVVLDKGISRVVLDLKVKCNNNMEGCQWIGELRNLKIHLDEVCGFQEKKDTRRLLTQVMDRLGRCEARLTEKDEQIENLQNELNAKNSIIENIQDKLKQTQEELSDLRSESESNGQSSSKKRKTISGDEVPQRSEESMEQLHQRVHRIERHVLNVEEYIPGQHTLYEWIIPDFLKNIKESGHLNSPKFYDTLGGHCCRLLIQSVSKNYIGLFLRCSKSIYEGGLNKPFTADYRFEVSNKDGKYHQKIFAKMADDFRQKNMVVPYGADNSIGGGSSNFLHKDSIDEFLIDDTLHIKCYLHFDI